MGKEKRSYLLGRLFGIAYPYGAQNGIGRVEIYQNLAKNYENFLQIMNNLQFSSDAHISRMASEVGTSPLNDDIESMNWFNEGWADQLERLRIGRMIADMRKQQGYSQRQLAERAFITPANLANIELGRYAMGLDVFRRIVEALGVQLDLVKKQDNDEP